MITAAEQISNDHTKIERVYDTSGRLTSENIYLNDQLLQQTKQSWEPSKRHLQIEDHQRTFTYLEGHLSQITSKNITLAYLYDVDGSLVNRSTNHTHVAYQYHFSGLPKTIITQANKEQFEETIQWDKSAKMSSYQSNWKKIPKEQLFAYNSQGQLQSINDEKYTFDFDKPGCGVRTESPNWTIDELDPFGKIIAEISEGKQITTLYDAAGQVVSRSSDEKQNFKWDPWGNLIEIITKAYTWKASYDALGRRLQTAYTPEDSAYFFRTKKKTLITTSFYDPEKEFDEIGVNVEGKTFWKLNGNKNCETIIDDEGNSISLIYDTLGKLIAAIDSENMHWNETLVTPYGPRGPPKPLESNLVSFAFAHTWQGRRVDPTGFIWMGARYYDPVGGKFLSTDPIRIPITLELYSYANGDPINFNDPDGRFASPVYETTSISLPRVYNFGIFETIASPLNRSNRFDLSDLGLREPPNGLGIGFVNGIQNSFGNFRKSLEYLSELSGGYNIHGVYGARIEPPLFSGSIEGRIFNACASFMMDLETCLLGMQHIDTGRVKHLHAMWDNHLDKNPDSYFLQFFHSRAGIDMTNALLSYSPERRKRISAVGIAPAGYVYEETCLNVINYRVSLHRDPIPYLDWKGARRAEHTIINLDSDPKAPLHDHGFQSPTYKKPIRDQINDFIKQYGSQR